MFPEYRVRKQTNGLGDVKFYPEINNDGKWEKISWVVKQKSPVQTLPSAISQQTTTSASVFLGSGYFEQWWADTFEEAIEQINAKKLDKLQSEYKEEIIEVP